MFLRHLYLDYMSYVSYTVPEEYPSGKKISLFFFF